MKGSAVGRRGWLTVAFYIPFNSLLFCVRNGEWNILHVIRYIEFRSYTIMYNRRAETGREMSKIISPHPPPKPPYPSIPTTTLAQNAHLGSRLR